MKGSHMHDKRQENSAHGQAQEAQQEKEKAATGEEEAVLAVPVNEPSSQGISDESQELQEMKTLREKAQKSDEHYDNYLRAVAELDNYRKRAVKERAYSVEAAQIYLIQGLLPIVDNFSRALLQVSGQSNAKNIQEGLSLIGRQVEAFMESVGLRPFSCVGEKFDPEKHEAVVHVPSKDHPDHTVLEEVQKGYLWHGRVVRHALVKVVDNPTAAVGESSTPNPTPNPNPDE